MMKVGKTNVHLADNLTIKVRTAPRDYMKSNLKVTGIVMLLFASSSLISLPRAMFPFKGIGRFDENFNAMEFSIHLVDHIDPA